MDADIESPWMTREEAANYLRVKPMTISTWGWQGQITPYKHGRNVRYKREEIESLFKAAVDSQEEQA